jgi:hypothetical protein
MNANETSARYEIWLILPLHAGTWEKPLQLNAVVPLCGEVTIKELCHTQTLIYCKMAVIGDQK